MDLKEHRKANDMQASTLPPARFGRIPPSLRGFLNAQGWAYGLFWSWNAVFLAFMILGFAPQLLPMMLAAVQAGEIPAVFLGYGIALTLVPVLTVVIGFVWLRKSPERLFALGYGVEGPLMLLLLVRLFGIREATLAVNVILTIAALGLATYLWRVLDLRITQRGGGWSFVYAVGATLLLLTGLYACTWLLFYIVPAPVFMARILGDIWREAGHFIADLWRALLEVDWGAFLRLQWQWVPFWLLGMVLFVFTGALVLVMPVAVMILYSKAWAEAMTNLGRRVGPRITRSLAAGVAVLMVILVIVASRQPQARAFDLLSSTPQTPAEAQALLTKEDEIRTGLLNAYLASFRYPSAVGELRHVSDMYQNAFKLSWNSTVFVQNLYETLYRPMLYVPVAPVDRQELTWRTAQRESVLRTEPLEAARLYETFFDRAITEGEHDTVVNAVRATWSVDRAQTALQAIDDREVYLVRQEVTVSEHGDWAEVELYEVYQNQTSDQEEVVYYFTLPESAVITGVWLGNSPDRDQRFTHRVSPRGAAQALYRNEVLVSRIDPALVEQIGPTQYRLRAYPVPPKQWIYDGDDWNRGHVEEADPLHLWLTWRVPVQDGAWALPYLADKRNVYWDDDSVRLINGIAIHNDDAESWLPPSVAASAPATPAEHRITFANGDTVTATPLSQVTLPTLPADVRLAVVVDRSRSMAAFAADVSASLARIQALTGSRAVVDTFLTSSPYRGERAERVGLASLAPDTILYYGGQNAADLLVQYDQLREGAAYDGVLVLTDGTGYELSAEGVNVPMPDAPVWMIHLNGNFPIGYDDGSLQAIQASGGGSVATVEEALARLAVRLNAAASAGAVVQDIADGYLWTVAPADRAEPVAVNEDGFSALAARRLILAEMQRNRGVLDDVETLDQLHAIAVAQSIVTPYSSMIVLVNQRQERQLDALEDDADRFAREYEGVGETTDTDPLMVTAVPEPEEWLLIGLTVAMLGWYAYTRRRSLVAQRS